MSVLSIGQMTGVGVECINIPGDAATIKNIRVTNGFYMGFFRM